MSAARMSGAARPVQFHTPPDANLHSAETTSIETAPLMWIPHRGLKYNILVQSELRQ